MNKTMQRYYVAYTSYFCSNPYDTDKIKHVLKEIGAKNIRTSYNFGWNNQPKVVSFSTDNPKKAERALNVTFETDWIIIYEKDW